MSIFTRTAAIALTVAGLPLLPPAAGSAVLQTHLQCYVIPAIGVSGPIGSGAPPRNAAITNNTSAPIPAGTTYSYTIAGRPFTYHSGSALAVGDHVLVTAQADAPAGNCDATIPRIVTNHIGIDPLKNLSVSP